MDRYVKLNDVTYLIRLYKRREMYKCDTDGYRNLSKRIQAEIELLIIKSEEK